MGQIGEIWISIGTRLDKFNRGMSDAERAMVRVGQKFQAVGKSLTMFVTLPIIAVGAASIKMAMDAVESENLFEVSMKDMATSARKWSSDLRDQLGLNSYEVRKNVATFNVMLNSMGLGTKASYNMAKGLTQLTYDMASFYNLKPEEAFQKLQSGISGEIEPLKRLGILVNENTIKHWALTNGMIKQGEVLTEQQKVTARYNVILEQTIDAQGDLARTLDSPTNKLRILKSRMTELSIDIGMKLMPAFERMLKHFEKAVNWFSDLSDANKDLVINVAVLAAALGPALMIFGKILVILPKITIALKATMSVLTLSTGGLLALAAAAVYTHKIISDLTKAKEEAVDADYRAFESNQKLGDKLREAGDAAGLTRKEFVALSQKYGENYAAMAMAIHKGKETVELQEALAKVGKKHKEAIDEQKKAHEKLIPVIEEQTKLLEKLGITLRKDLEEKLKDSEQGLKDFRSQMTTAEVEKLEEEIKNLRIELGLESAIFEELSLQSIPQKKKAIEDLTAQLDTLTKEYNKGNVTLEDYREETSNLKTEIESLRVGIDTEAIPAARDLSGVLESVATSLDSKPYEDWGAVLEKYGVQTVKQVFKNLTELNKEQELLDLAYKSGAISLDEYKKGLEKIKEALKEAGKSTTSFGEDWEKAFSMMGSLLQVLADEVGGAFGNLVSTVGLAFGNIRKSTDKSIKGIAEAIGPVLAGKVGGAIGQLISGSKNSFASLGSSIGGIAALIPGIGVVAGTVFSAIGGLIGGLFKKKKTEAQKAAEAAAEAAKKLEQAMNSAKGAVSRYGVITDETAKKIAESAKTMGNAGAVAKYFGDVINDIGPTQENLNKLWKGAIDILDQYAKKKLSAGDASKSLGESFTQLVEAAQKFGVEGSKAMIDFLGEVQKSGLQVQEVTDYIVGQLDRIPDALSSLIAPAIAAGESLDILRDKLAAQNEELAKLEEGTDAYNDLRAAIAVTGAQITAATITFNEFGDDVERAGILALTTFNAMIDSGVSWHDALAKMKDPLLALKEQYEALGITGNVALAELFEVEGLIEKNKELFDALDANKIILEALGNTGFLTQTTMTALASEMSAYYRSLTDAGATSNQAIKMMAPNLQKIYDYAQIYGLTVDDNTQKLIDQGLQLGVVTEQSKEPGDVIREGFEKFRGFFKEMMGDMRGSFRDLGDRFEEIMLGVGSGISDTISGNFQIAFGNAESAASSTATVIGNTLSRIRPVVGIGFDYAIPDFSGLTGKVTLGFTKAGGKGGGGFQYGGIAWTPQLATVAEREPEIIMPLREYRQEKRGGDGGGGIVIHFAPQISAMDSQDVRKFFQTKGREEIISLLKTNLRGFSREFKTETEKF